MAVSLVGEVVNSCDSTTGFSAGSISGDDDFVEGSGAIGAKVSNATTSFYTTSLGAGAPYDFSVGGTEEGYHIIMYFGNKTPTNATAGQRIVIGNGTSRGEWYVPLSGVFEPKQSVFMSRVVDTARDFDNIAAGSWTVGGNPAQASNVTQMGGTHQTTTSIMGSFNNCQIDQITTGLGVRVDAGTGGSPNTFETVRSQDEDTSKWGWWSSVVGAFVGKGKLYFGPATGTATSVFDDTGFSVIFADELVASDFYEFAIRGTNTDVLWELGNISAADTAIARWGITVDQTDGPNDFSDTNSTMSGGGVFELDSATTFTGTTIVDTTQIIQNSATLDGLTVLLPNVTTGVAFLESDDPSLISNCEFNANTAGHAIEITTTGTYTFDSNTFVGYGADGTNDAAIYNNSGGLVTLNITGTGGTPTVRNGTSASTVAAKTVAVTVTVKDASTLAVVAGARVYLLTDSGGPAGTGVEVLNADSNVSGIVEDTGYVFVSDQGVEGRVRRGTSSPLYKTAPLSGTITATGLEITVFLVSDE